MIDTTVTNIPLTLREYCNDDVDMSNNGSFHPIQKISSSRSCSQKSFGSLRAMRKYENSSSSRERTSSLGLRRSSNSLYRHSLSSLSIEAGELQKEDNEVCCKKVPTTESISVEQSKGTTPSRLPFVKENCLHLGMLIPNWLQNGIIFMGLYHQSFAVIIMMYLVQSVVFQYSHLESLTDIKCWVKVLTVKSTSVARNVNGRNSTLENIRQYYNRNKSNECLNGYESCTATPTSSPPHGMRKNTSDEWGHFTDFDETFTEISSPIVTNTLLMTTKRNAVDANASLNLGTVPEIDDEEELES